MPRFTQQTDATLRRQLAGTTLGAACRFASPVAKEDVGIVPLFWREESNDWGGVMLRYPQDAPAAADTIRTCDLLRGAPAGVADDIELDPAVVYAHVRLR